MSYRVTPADIRALSPRVRRQLEEATRRAEAAPEPQPAIRGQRQLFGLGARYVEAVIFRRRIMSKAQAWVRDGAAGGEGGGLIHPTLPTVEPRARQLFRSIYARHSAGCCLHVVLDDGNLEGRFLQGEPPHDDCRELLGILRTLTITQRRKLQRRLFAMQGAPLRAAREKR